MSDETPQTGALPTGGEGNGGRMPGADITRYLPNRSIGLKLLLVCALALAMAIPAGFVWALVYERAHNAESAVDEVSQTRGGRQTIMGPVLIVPIEQTIVEKVPVPGSAVLMDRTVTKRSRFVVFAETGKADAVAETEILTRGIHDVPVFESKVQLNAAFDLQTALRDAPRDARLIWDEAEIYMGLTDLRGMRDGLAATLSGEALKFEPASSNNPSIWGDNSGSLTHKWLGLVAAPVEGLDPDAAPQFSIMASMVFSGAERLAFAAFAKDTDIHLEGDWSTPKFSGGFLPVEREWSDAGFVADWRVTYLARGAPGAGVNLMLDGALNADLAIEFLDQASPYQSVTRSLKYAPMFIGLVFLAYFLFEATSGNRAHPAQYLLVGLAQTVFYLLLLGVSEHVGFTLGFLIAASATVMLLSLYAGAVFKSRDSMLQAFAGFTTLYGLIYVLMRMEDYALLVGSVASFVAIAATMWMTRNLDWYGLSGDRREPT